MKKWFGVILGIILMISLAACCYALDETVQETEKSQDQESDVEEQKILVTYFSHTGNTAEVAELIADYTGGDLAEIERAIPYGDVYEEAEDEILEGVRPEITVSADNIEEYDTVFVGYPIWWDEAPAMISSFLSNYNFAEKTLVPFCTSASDDIDHSLHIFSELCPDSVIKEGLTANDTDDILPWLQEMELNAGQTDATEGTPITITVGNTVIEAELDDSPVAREFAALLPQTISMQRIGGDREFYGEIEESLNYDEEDSQTTFENGDIAYWYSGNAVCLLYNNQVEDSQIDSGIIVFGNIKSDLSVFSQFSDYEEMIIALAE